MRSGATVEVIGGVVTHRAVHPEQRDQRQRQQAQLQR